MVEEDNTPLSITITPCGSRLEWRVSIHDLPGEGSANGPGQLINFKFLFD